MDVEKRTSKGGFLQLFDWNTKSRKKLFSNKSEFHEDSKQGNEIVANSIALHPQPTELCENGPGPRGRRNSHYDMNHDEGYESRAPGIVAKLMGLDSLPTSTASEVCSAPFSDSLYVRDYGAQRSTSNFQIGHHIMNNLPNDGMSRNLVEARPQKVQSWPIERFQTEILPPKSAKAISITHHRLLSPIKNPGFIQTNNTAYIMEAASKIIEQGPPSATKGKMPLFGSSSVPLRIRDLKERMEAAHRASGPPEPSRRPKESISLKYNKGQHSETNYSGLGDSRTYNASVGSIKGSSDRMNNKGKSVSLAVQAKSNIQRRDVVTSSSNKSSLNPKEGDEVKLRQFNRRSRTSMEKGVQKKTSTSRTDDVLRQNNQKQNCIASNDKIALKASVSNQQDRKAPTTGSSVKSNKSSNTDLNLATGSKKINSVVKTTRKELMPSNTKTSSEKRQTVHRDVPNNLHLVESVAKVPVTKDERTVKRNVANDDCLNWDLIDRKNSMDVISFTFTSPIKRSVCVSQSTSQVMVKNTRFYVDSCDDGDPHDSENATLSSPSLNVNCGDALSVLLEQKLKELTCRVESSNCKLYEAGSAACSAFSFQDSLATVNIINTAMERYNNFQLSLHNDNSSRSDDTDGPSVDDLLLKAKQKWQRSEEMEAHSSNINNHEYGKEHECQYSIPISNVEPSCFDGSYDSSDSKTSSIVHGCKNCSLAEAHGMADCIFGRKCQPYEVEAELSDSASSTSAACMGSKGSSATFSLVDFESSSNWELQYIREILCSSELILEDVLVGPVDKMIAPHLFDQLEIPRTALDETPGFKLGRKILFDCVNECLELRSVQLLGGCCKALSKWESLFRRKGLLAEEFYREISGWTSMGDLLVDELVDKDMSSGRGKWVDFDNEAFEEGVEIEKGILTSLIDEVFSDF